MNDLFCNNEAIDCFIHQQREPLNTSFFHTGRYSTLCSPTALFPFRQSYYARHSPTEGAVEPFILSTIVLSIFQQQTGTSELFISKTPLFINRESTSFDEHHHHHNHRSLTESTLECLILLTNLYTKRMSYLMLHSSTEGAVERVI